jgi:CheY-like chemotaxis protein
LNTNTKPKILVVDDQPINIRSRQRRLEQQGMKVELAYNGRERLEKFKEFRPTLVLLNIMMPEMDGIAACEHLMTDPETEAIPVISITTKTAIGRRMGLRIARHSTRNLDGEGRVKENKDQGVTAVIIHPLSS